MGFGAGSLKERVTFSSRTLTTNSDNGEQTESFANLATTPTVWAAWMPLMAGESERTSGRQSVTKAKFIIRHRDDLDVTMRLTHRSRTYNITGLEPWGKEHRMWLAVFVSEIPADG